MNGPSMCPRAEWILESAVDATEKSAGEHSPDAHMSSCPDCREAIALIRSMKAAAPAFGVPEPSAAYWAGFNARVRDRIGGEAGESAPRNLVSVWVPRLTLVAAAAGLALLAVLSVDPGRGISTLPAPGRSRAQATEVQLLESLGSAESDRVLEVLDGPEAQESPASVEDLSALDEDLSEFSQGAGLPDATYEIYMELGPEEKGLLLKEMRGETG